MSDYTMPLESWAPPLDRATSSAGLAKAASETQAPVCYTYDAHANGNSSV